MYQPTVRNSGAWDGSLRSDWSFDTVRTTSAMGSLRSMARDITPPATIPDEGYYEDAPSMYDEESIDTSAATKGSEVPLPGSGALGMNSEAQYSTVIIKQVPTIADVKEVPPMVSDDSSNETAGNGDPETPPPSVEASEPPPAYSGSVRSVRSTRRASFQARNNTNIGTVLGEADIGNGIDTIRPVKKVDTMRSLRMSEEYVGTTRSREGREGSSSNSSSPTTSPKSSQKRATSEAAEAGRSIVDDVMVPLLAKVWSILYRV